MITCGLLQADEGPRWVIAVGYSERLTPKALLDLCRQGHQRWGIFKCLLVWYMRDHQNKATFPIDMRDVFRDPELVLLSVGSSMVRSAIRRGMESHLPLQFFGGSTPVLDPTGRPIPVGQAGDLASHSPVHPDYLPPERPDVEAELEDFLRDLRDGNLGDVTDG